MPGRVVAVVIAALAIAVAGAPQARAAAGHAPVNVALPTITGTATPGATLTASPGSWTEEPVSLVYSWERCFPAGCILDLETTSSTYVVQPVDAEQLIQLKVKATNLSGWATATSAQLRVERAWQFGVGPPRTEVADWRAVPPPVPWSMTKELQIDVSSGMCVGEGTPFISGVRVRTPGPGAELPFPSAVLTTSITFPSPTTVIGTVNPGEVLPVCAGIGIGLSKDITLKRPVAGLFLYDASYSPPRLILRPDRLLRWRLVGQPDAKTIKIAVAYTACTQAQTSIVPRVVEHGDRAVITTYQEMNGPRREAGCLRLRGRKILKVSLGRPVRELELSDGSYSPPQPRPPA
jgi:hypothetical protein